MRVKTYRTISNTGKLEITNDVITIKNGYWLSLSKGIINDIQSIEFHPMKFKKCFFINEKYVYFLYYYGGKKFGTHISLNWFENQKFLILQNKHWFQRGNNIMWVINMVILIGSILTTTIHLFKSH